MSSVLFNFVIITKKRIAMYKIQANASGTRSIEISDEHLQTISKYSLFDGLVDGNGFVDEPVLDKLKFHVRSLLENTVENDKALLDLCLDVIYKNNMKALGLQNLIVLYREWAPSHVEENAEAQPTDGE